MWRRLTSAGAVALFAFGFTFASAAPAQAVDLDAIPSTVINALATGQLLKAGVNSGNPELVGILAVGTAAGWCLLNDCGGTVLHWVTNMGGTATQGTTDTYNDQGNCGYWSHLPATHDPLNVIGDGAFVASNGCAELSGQWDLIAKCSNPDGSYSTQTRGFYFIFGAGAESNAPISTFCQGTGQLLVALYSYGTAQIAWEAIGYSPVNRSLTQELTCRNAAGSEVVVSATTNYTGSQTDALMPSCPSGYTPKKVDVYQGTANAGKGTKVATTGVTDSAFDLYPRCVTGDLRGTCTVGVWINSGVTECTLGTGDCLNVGLDSGPNYTCKWGPYTLPKTACVKRIQQLTPTATPSASPSASPSATFGGSGASGTGIDAPPINDPTQGTVDNPVDSTDCSPSGWGYFNPKAYVVQTICMFKLLFIPHEGFLGAFQAAGAGIMQTDVGTWVNSAVQAPGDVIDVFRPNTGAANVDGLVGTGGIPKQNTDCEGPTIHVPMGPYTQDIQPLNACAEPAKTLANVTKNIGAAGIVLVTVGHLANLALGFFGMRLPFRFETYDETNT